MANGIENLLVQLEELSAKALEQAAAADIMSMAETLKQRAVAITQLQTALPGCEAISFTEWNRLAVIHFQGNRIQENLLALRLRLAAELVQNVREQALLECVGGIVSETAPARLNEHG